MSACGDTNDFTIPKGLDFDFTVQVLQENSFLPQDLTGFLNGTFKLIDISTGASIPGVNDVVLSKITEDVIDPIVLVEEELELTIAVNEAALYYIDINGTRYSVDYTAGAAASTAAVADALYALMTVVPQDVSVVHTPATAVITIKNTVGQSNTVLFTNNIAQTNYIKGVEAVDGYTSTYYNDNGFLKGNIPAIETGVLNVSRGDAVDGYYLKPTYQGILQVNFSDNTLNKTAIVCQIYVVYTGA